MTMGDVDRATGGAVSKSTISRIEQGRQHTLSPPLTQALAKALGLPVSRLNAAQGHHGSVPTQPFVLPDRAQRLTARERRVVLSVMDALLEAHRS